MFDLRQKKRRRVPLVLLCVILIITTGCGSLKNDVRNPAADEKMRMISIVDCAGRKVEIPADSKRVACLYAFAGHVMVMLGKEDYIIAAVNGLKRDKMMLELAPNIAKAYTPILSGSINIEELVKADPDFVFLKGDVAADKGETAKLDECHIPYLVVDYKTMADQQYAIEMIGKAVGAEDRAKEYNEYYKDIVEKVQKTVADIPTTTRIRVYHSVNEAVRTDVKDTLPDDWIKAINAVNVSTTDQLKLYENEYYATLEQIYLWDPDVIIANESGVAQYILTNEKWAALRAVKRNRVYQMPNGISRWGHPGSMETPLAVLWTAQMLYPDYFKDVDMKAVTESYYQRFFGISLDAEAVSTILSGNGMRIPKQ